MPGRDLPCPVLLPGKGTDSRKLCRMQSLKSGDMKDFFPGNQRNSLYFTEFSAQAPEEISFCVAVPPESNGEFIKHLPKFTALSVFHHGAYESIAESRQKLVSYAHENSLMLSGTFRSIFLEGPPQHKDKSKFITQIVAIFE